MEVGGQGLKKGGDGPYTYVSLFSSAGVGCYGFKQEKFECIATVEILERRLKIQAYNNKCRYRSGYICGDLTKDAVKSRVFEQIEKWNNNFGISGPDVLIATPPCQGMSVANHKKKDELNRNSLVVESIRLTKELRPKFFLYENVKPFLRSVCTDVDGVNKSIGEAITQNLSGLYNIHSRVLNFKEYGSPSSRTRTLVIGVRKDLRDITPLDLFPDRVGEVTLRQTIGHLPPLAVMGEIHPEDIYHNFRSYTPNMERWISGLREGESAFDNPDPSRIPHTVKDGKVVYNARKNGDKYTRQRWDQVAPCVHTRNDILASQNTVHPADNRVFSIRELMLMMSVPSGFKWSAVPYRELNGLSEQEKKAFLKSEELNIRQCLGEAVPTAVFRQVARKIRVALAYGSVTENDIKTIIKEQGIAGHRHLLAFVSRNRALGFPMLSKIAELANSRRNTNAAYYTRQDICYNIIDRLPEANRYRKLRILEPSIGVGNFLPLLAARYGSVPQVTIDVVDIDKQSIAVLKELVKTLDLPGNITVNYITADFLLHTFAERYQIVIGNPPFGKLPAGNPLLSRYREGMANQDTANIFSFFIEKCLRLGDTVSLIVPKSLLSAPEFDKTREAMSRYRITDIIDHGEKGFKGVKIETVNFIIDTSAKPGKTTVSSLITNRVETKPQEYITDGRFPSWLIYRNREFDRVADRMRFGIFNSYRDRVITKKLTTTTPGKYRVLKSRNIGDNRIVDIEGYDSYMDDISGLDAARFLDRENCILVPNLTYYPRACFMPAGCIADGSVAILTTKDPAAVITREDLAFYGSDEFREFYAVARNRGTRSLNIDNNSVFFFGIANKNEPINKPIPEDMREIPQTDRQTPAQMVKTHLSKVNLDIRKMEDARFLDQKCTPDVIAFIADCVMNLATDGRWFTVRDIWDSQYFANGIKLIYGKPDPSDETAEKEYDKIIRQPLRLFDYAGLLERKTQGNTFCFRIRNEEILDYISRNYHHAFVFLLEYIEKLLYDSSLKRIFDSYKNKHDHGKPTRDEFLDLKAYFKRYLWGHTRIKGNYEPDRIFPKILNVLAVQYQLYGAVKGSISRDIFTFSDLMYNRKNWRDAKKQKSLTRQQAAALIPEEDLTMISRAYLVQKAKGLVRRLHAESEVRDQWANGDATQVHHIFPEKDFPQIAHFPENLICLTATQHFTKAHPNNNTQSVNRDYQMTCLLSKADSIERSIRTDGDKNYSKERFLQVIETGLDLVLDPGLEFREIKLILIEYYNNH